MTQDVNDDDDNFGGDDGNTCETCSSFLFSQHLLIRCISVQASRSLSAQYSVDPSETVARPTAKSNSGDLLAGQDEGDWAVGTEGVPDSLVAAPRKVERVPIKYAQASKQASPRRPASPVQPALIVACQISANDTPICAITQIDVRALKEALWNALQNRQSSGAQPPACSFQVQDAAKQLC